MPPINDQSGAGTIGSELPVIRPESAQSAKELPTSRYTSKVHRVAILTNEIGTYVFQH